jgi:hypothetical protein
MLNADHSAAALYDLKNDPLELFDLSSKEETLTRKMQARFVAALKELKRDPLRSRMGQTSAPARG